MKHFILFIIVCIGIISCKQKPHTENDNKILTHHAVKFDNDFIGRGGFLVALKDGVVGFEESASMTAAFYRVKKQGDAHVLTRFIGRGQGPNEVLRPFNIQYLSEDSIGVYDVARMTYYSFSVSKNPDSVELKSNIRFEELHHRAIRTASNRYVILSAQVGMLSLLNNDGTLNATFFEYPYKDDVEKNVPNNIRASAYQGALEANPDATKCVYAPFNGEIIHFYNIEKDNIVLISKREVAYPDYIIDNANQRAVTKGNTTITGYISIAATNRFVYALFCGKITSDMIKNKEDIETQILRIYDWQGNLVRETNLDVPCRNICVSHDDRTMWAIAKTVDDLSLVWFDLSEKNEKTTDGLSETAKSLDKQIVKSEAEQSSTEIAYRLEVKNPKISKEDSIVTFSENFPAIKSFQSTSRDIQVNVEVIKNVTKMVYIIKKDAFGAFSDTVHFQFENGQTMKAILYGNVK
jgi:hypothetical protein